MNPMSGPDGEEVTPDGKTLFTAIGNAGVVVFDLSTMDLTKNPPTAPNVIATIPTGTSADYDGPLGIAPCVASWNGEAGSAATCGDDRADEMAYDPVHQVLAVINGDPGLPFVTFIDMSHIVSKTGTLAQQHCLPLDPTLAYGPWAAGFTPADYGVNYPFQGSGSAIPQPSPILDPGVAGTSFNPPSCIIGQIYYDGAGGGASAGAGLNPAVPVDTVGATFPCPDPSNPHVFSGVSGGAANNAVLGLPGSARHNAERCHLHHPVPSRADHRSDYGSVLQSGHAREHVRRRYCASWVGRGWFGILTPVTCCRRMKIASVSPTSAASTKSTPAREPEWADRGQHLRAAKLHANQRRSGSGQQLPRRLRRPRRRGFPAQPFRHRRHLGRTSSAKLLTSAGLTRSGTTRATIGITWQQEICPMARSWA